LISAALTAVAAIVHIPCIETDTSLPVNQLPLRNPLLFFPLEYG